MVFDASSARRRSSSLPWADELTMLYRGMTIRIPIESLSDVALLEETERVARSSRVITAQLIALLVEVDGRELYLDYGCSSLFAYCIRALRLSEDEAYGRLPAVRAAGKYPVILDSLADGTLTVTNVALLAPLLTDENHLRLLDAARGKSKQEVERQVAALKPDSPSGVTVTLTFSYDTYDKLRKAQGLLRHAIPSGDYAEVIDRGLTLLITDVEKRKFGVTDRPSREREAADDSRHIPAWVKRAVMKRDGGRCAFIGTHGRCNETAFLEFHHIIPFAAGGRSTVENIQLRCGAHNRREAEVYFGAHLPTRVREVPPMYSVSVGSSTRSGAGTDFAADVGDGDCGPGNVGSAMGSYEHATSPVNYAVCRAD